MGRRGNAFLIRAASTGPYQVEILEYEEPALKPNEVRVKTEFASGNRSKLVRTVDGKAEEKRIRLDRLLNRGDLSENLEVRPGDVVVVPASVF